MINNRLRDFPQVECLREEETGYIKIRSIKDVFAILTLFTIFQLFSASNVSDEWKSRCCLHDQVEQLNKIGAAATARRIDEEPGRTGKCEIVCRCDS